MQISRDYQQGFYSSTASVRDQKARLRKAYKIMNVLTKWGGRPLSSSICLDLGCSSGVITGALAPLFHKTVGMEFDAVALSCIPKDVPSSTFFVQADVMRLPLLSESIDVVVCSQIYEHVPDDTMLVREIHRVLKPGGGVFFSGPNKLFPIEPHYFLPFLHWMPPRWADLYLKVTGKGDHYYERSRTLRSLRHLLTGFSIIDVTAEIVREDADLVMSRRWASLLCRIPRFFWRILIPILPNFNLLLLKPDARTAAVGDQKPWNPTPVRNTDFSKGSNTIAN